MNEKIHELHAIEQKADELYKVWRKHLDKFGHRNDYWDRIIEQASAFDRNHPDTDHYAGHVITARVKALEDEWRKLKGRNI